MPDAPLGPPLDLAQEAEVTERDKNLAQRFWAHYATPLLKRLLGARRKET